MVKVHMPYWPPSVLVLISVFPPIAPQLTDAGFAIPSDPGAAGLAAVVAAATPVVCAAVGAAVVAGVVVVCWVHPDMSRAAKTQAARRITIRFLDIMIISGYVFASFIKKISGIVFTFG